MTERAVVSVGLTIISLALIGIFVAVVARPLIAGLSAPARSQQQMIEQIQAEAIVERR